MPAPYRLRRDRVDGGGAVTLRHDSRLHNIKVGRAPAGTKVLMLVAGLDVRIVTQDGELLRRSHSTRHGPTSPCVPGARRERYPETGVNDVSRNHTGGR